MKAQISTQPSISSQVELLSNSATHSASLSERFFNWTDKMDYYRLIILAFAIIAQGCFTGPFALFTMSLAVGFSWVQISIIVAGIFSVLVTNLAVQPMRVTIPVFLLATLGQLAIIIYNLILIA